MAAFRSRSSHQGNGSGSLTSTITLANPAGLADGDHMLAILVIGFGTAGLAVSAVPSGWTLLYASGAISNGGGSYGYFFVYEKMASSEPGSRSWTLNNSVAFYNCTLVASSGVNTVTPHEQLSSTQAASQSNGAAMALTADTTGISETLVTILMAQAGSPTFTESAGSETFETQFGNCDIAFNMLDLASPTHQTVTGTLALPSGTAAIAAVQLALNPVAVNATVVAPAAAATASRPAPAAVQGVSAPAARATATGVVPPVITGSKTVTAVPAMATASAPAPRGRSTRIPLTMYPDVGGEIALVEDTP